MMPVGGIGVWVAVEFGNDFGMVIKLHEVMPSTSCFSFDITSMIYHYHSGCYKLILLICGGKTLKFHCSEFEIILLPIHEHH